MKASPLLLAIDTVARRGLLAFALGLSLNIVTAQTTSDGFQAVEKGRTTACGKRP
jgi:hypothetical protein